MLLNWKIGMFLTCVVSSNRSITFPEIFRVPLLHGTWAVIVVFLLNVGLYSDIKMN